MELSVLLLAECVKTQGHATEFLSLASSKDLNRRALSVELLQTRSVATRLTAALETVLTVPQTRRDRMDSLARMLFTATETRLVNPEFVKR